MKEFLGEIFSSIRQNKLRTVLTGFSVAWGIFMLIILLGSGNGLKNGVNSNFEGMSTNSVSIYPGSTSESYGGYQKGRRIKLKLEDIDYISSKLDNVENLNGTSYYSGKIRYTNKYGNMSIVGIMPSFMKYRGMKLKQGRFLNELDVIEKRKVIVLAENTVDMLFPKTDPVGKDVIVDEVHYLVVGVVKLRWSNNNLQGYMPLTTAMSIYASDDALNDIRLEAAGVKSVEESEKLNDDIRAVMSQKLHYAPTDKNALYVWGSIEEYLNTQMVFAGISMFIWIIGLGTLMAGIVGVSNIMLVTVRERTNEFGIRKSMGASPASLVRLVLAESIFITAIFGYIGMFGGIAIMEIVNYVLTTNFAPENSDMPVVFKDPTLDIGVVVSATLVLVIAGFIAGFVPARRAARLKTIDAMRYNK